MKCLFCPAEMLVLKDVWCPNCKTHYVFEWDTVDNKAIIKQYKFQNASRPDKPLMFCHAMFFPENRTNNAHFEIRMYDGTPFWDSYKVLVQLDYLPDNITPFNFSEKLKTYLVFS